MAPLDSDQPSAGGRTDATRPGRQLALVAIALLTSAFALVLGYFAYAARGGWFMDTPAIQFVRADASAIRGKSIDRGPIRVFLPGEDGGVVIRFADRPFEADSYRTLRLAARADAFPLDAKVLWRRADQPDRTFSLDIPWVGEGTERVSLAADPEWRGRVIGIAIAVRLPPRTPLAFASMSILPDTGRSVAREVLAEWSAVEPWTQASVHYLRGGSPNPRLPLSLAAGAVALLATAAYVALARWKRVSISLASVASLVLIPWLALDLRWQVNLARNHAQAASLFAGRAIEEKHRAADDQEIYNLAESIRRSLPQGITKVTLASDLTASPYFLGKLRYYLFPLWVHPKPEDAVEGEIVAVFQSSAVTFSEATGSLQFRSGPPLAVERLEGTPPLAFYKVRK